MRTAIPIDNVWQMLQTLSLSSSNKEWLANKLIDSSKEDKREQEAAFVRESMQRAMLEVKEVQQGHKKLQSADDFFAELNQEAR